MDGWIVAAGSVARLPAAGGGIAATRARVVASCRSTRSGLPGCHNVSNVLAAVARRAAVRRRPRRDRAAVVAASAASSTASSRWPIVDGVRFVNDSMGTQPDAVIAALRSFRRPLVLIAGGRAKDLRIDELARVVAERATAAVLIGESGPALAATPSAPRARPASRPPRHCDGAVERADAIVRARLQLAGRGARAATVLLSPAAASFDMFADYAARGARLRGRRTDLARAPRRRRSVPDD